MKNAKVLLLTKCSYLLIQMKIGDIVLIPSAGGDQLAIGVIKSDVYIYDNKSSEDIDDILDDEERGYKSCPYLKRRNIQWIKQ